MTAPIEGEIKTELGNFNLPWNKTLRIEDVDFGNGVKLVRITVREGKRITMFDLDPDGAARLKDILANWAEG